MPPLIDLGFCPICSEDLEDTTSGVVRNVRFCKLCCNQIQGNEALEKFHCERVERYAKVKESLLKGWF